jgi:hypothetical protein
MNSTEWAAELLREITRRAPEWRVALEAGIRQPKHIISNIFWLALADRTGPVETHCSSTISSSAVGRSDQTASRYETCGDRGNVSNSRSGNATKLSAAVAE